MSEQPERHDPLPGPLGLPGFLLRKLSPGGRRVALAIGALLGAAGVLAAVLALPAIRERQRDRDAAQAKRSQADRGARLARIAREARPLSGRGPGSAGLGAAEALRARRALLTGVEAAVLADARRRARRGELRARYRSARCFEYPKRLSGRSPAEDLARRTARLECLAVYAVVPTGDQSAGSLIGQPFRARVDFASGRYAWCKIVQVPGELSAQRGIVLRIPRDCGGRL